MLSATELHEELVIAAQLFNRELRLQVVSSRLQHEATKASSEVRGIMERLVKESGYSPEELIELLRQRIELHDPTVTQFAEPGIKVEIHFDRQTMADHRARQWIQEWVTHAPDIHTERSKLDLSWLP